MTPIFWGWCGCTVWPLAIGVAAGRCGRCRRHPVFVADDIDTTPGGVTKDEAKRMVRAGEVAWRW